MKHALLRFAGLAAVLLHTILASAQNTPGRTVMSPDQVAVSRDLSDALASSPADGLAVHNPQPLPQHRNGRVQDDVLQSVSGFAMSATDGASFPGAGYWNDNTIYAFPDWLE